MQGPRPPGDRTRIVIADDDRGFSKALRSSLEAHDAFEVVGIASDGEETIHLVETLKPSLVLIDVALPGLDGVEVTRRMRDMSDSPAVVLMTAAEGPDRRALEVGAEGYLRKNSDLNPLVDIVVAFAGLHASSP